MPCLQVRFIRRDLWHVASRTVAPDSVIRNARVIDDGDVILQGEEIAQLAVVPLAPQMPAVGGGNQLCRDPDAIACAPHASFQHMGDAQCLGDPPDILLPAAKRER